MSKKFLLGASIASHQVAGGEHDQWTVWEELNAERLAKNAHKELDRLGNWPEIKERAENPLNYISSKGVEHYDQFREDFDLLEKLGLNSLRFSIHWSSIEPAEGIWDKKAIEFYHQYFKELKSRNITPIVTLWHWAHPHWFAERGALVKKKNIPIFERYASFVLEEFGHYFDYFVIINEPNVYSILSYLLGTWPPAKRSPIEYWKVFHNLIKVQKNVYEIAKAKRPKLKVGMAHQMNASLPKNNKSLWDRCGANLERSLWNWWFLDKTKGYFDFIGVNYYFTNYHKGLRRKNPYEPSNDLGWYMDPSKLYDVLMDCWERYNTPMIITETGVADEKDQYREWWIRETLSAVKKAKAQGVDVFGYIHWTLLDNFEWSYGWWPKFGLIEVDRNEPGMPRKIRGSSKTLKNYKQL